MLCNFEILRSFYVFHFISQVV